ncbi:hypothetical protein GTY65_16955 [Streptomyces sp. SID8379]|uniref:hypothetical protein n=1 Tax=unclassified Streptomyces TaxID=2593676 RepID=UPI00037438D1|nr:MULTISPECIES: hypothetical protein [unclassified Streptomyces]MYW65731.1 hypothetical protein [Streptomyces sp. SID8379]
MVSKVCTECDGTMQEFENLTPEQQDHVLKHKPKYTRLRSYLHCTSPDCLRYQLRGNKKIGGSFPPPEDD